MTIRLLPAALTGTGKLLTADCQASTPARRGSRVAGASSVRLTPLFILCLVMFGCAGGGSIPAPAPVAPEVVEQQRREEFAERQEFRNQYGLAQIKAHYAYARGATGAGVALGVIDTGVDPAHPSFQGKLEVIEVDDYQPDFSACDRPAADGSCQSDLGHGTYVAGIMAGGRRADPGAANGAQATIPAAATTQPDNSGRTFLGGEAAVHGVAFDATVISMAPDIELDADLIPTPPENATPEELEQFIEQLEEYFDQREAEIERQIASAFDTLNPRVTAVNASLGLPGSIEDFTAEELRVRFPNVIRAVAQADVPAAERSIYVWAAGNARGEIQPDGSTDSAASVEIVAGLPVRLPELRGHSLAVVATDRDGNIADFSNRCGIAQDFCLAAPGIEVTGPVPAFYCPAGTTECFAVVEDAGTSAAAPFVTGGIALLAQHYRNQLGNDELVARLLNTADKTGAYADADTYGQGLLDLDAATRPLGQTRLLIGESLFGAAALTSDSMLRQGAAFGDALARGLAAKEVASFDEAAAPFFHALDDYLYPDVAASVGLEERLYTLGNERRSARWQHHDVTAQIRLTRARNHHTDHADLATQVWRHNNHTAASIPLRVASLSTSWNWADGQFFLGYRDAPNRWLEAAADATAYGRRVWLNPGAFSDPAAFTNPYLGLARNGASLGYARPAGRGAWRVTAWRGSAQYGEQQDPDAARATGVLAEYRRYLPSSSGVSLQLGWLTEAERVLGQRARGAFGAFEGATAFLGLSTVHRLNDVWTLLGSAHLGLSQAAARDQGMLRDPSTLWTSAFSLGLSGDGISGARDRLALRLSQPLRVEAGHAHLRWVSGRTPQRRLRVEQARLELTPSGRQLDLELTYSRPWGGGRAYLATVASRDVGHVRGAHDVALLMRYRAEF
ncbi:MAG: S8 family serine peptidase [Gammaproteobacteria bacterium]|nr:S8 family serine peptidase [Gammaproteobacteria bacterium]